MQKVDTGIADNTYIEIKNGLKAGDEVVSGSYTAISRKLKDGMKVQIEKAEDVVRPIGPDTDPRNRNRRPRTERTCSSKTLPPKSWRVFRIALSVIRAHKMRSVLTALGVIIGIIAVTLMGSAIGGIEVGFERSLAVIGDDILYVEKWPWHNVDDWWNYRNRRRIETSYADDLKRIIAATPNSELVTAVPTLNTGRNVKFGDNQVRGVFTQGTTDEFLVTSTSSFKEGRFFTETESRGGHNVVVLGYDVAEALFPTGSALDKTVMIDGNPVPRDRRLVERWARSSASSASTRRPSFRSDRSSRTSARGWTRRSA